MPRTYLKSKQIAAPAPSTEGKQIPLNAKLYGLRQASQLLNEQFDGGFSIREMRRLINSGAWLEHWHYTRRGRQIKVYLVAVQEWQLRR
jgi:hypothetical protein